MTAMEAVLQALLRHAGRLCQFWNYTIIFLVCILERGNKKSSTCDLGLKVSVYFAFTHYVEKS